MLFTAVNLCVWGIIDILYFTKSYFTDFCEQNYKNFFTKEEILYIRIVKIYLEILFFTFYLII